MNTQSDQAAETALLTPEEQTICEAISKTVSPHKQRAQLLLAVDSGVTQAEAGDAVGLSVGQTKYWLTKFRKLRLEAFPDDVLEAVEPEPVFGSTEDFSAESLQEETPEPEPEVEQEAEEKEESVPDEEPVKAKKQKKKKAKKAGKKKKGKKSKKDKKDKKKKKNGKKNKKGKKAKKKKKKK